MDFMAKIVNWREHSNKQAFWEEKMENYFLIYSVMSLETAKVVYADGIRYIQNHIWYVNIWNANLNSQ